MKLCLFYVMAFLIAFVSMQVIDHQGLEFSESNEIKSFLSNADIELAALKEVDPKSISKKNHYIAQAFVAIYCISTFYTKIENFFYYLPIYNLLREKEFFLII